MSKREAILRADVPGLNLTATKAAIIRPVLTRHRRCAELRASNAAVLRRPRLRQPP
jgi:hypothetical protein